MPSRPRPILLANELGRGFGHLEKLLSVARGLQAVGRRALLAVPEPAAVARLAHLAGDLPVLQAPRLERAPAPGPLETMGDILAAAGFADAQATRGVVEDWHRILAGLQPALVITD